MIARLGAALVCAAAFAQPAAASADELVATTRDEPIHLDIRERRIDRGPYEASLEVGVDRPVFVRVGVALSADRITVILSGVHGDGQFRANLARITRIIAAHSGRAVSDREKP